MDKGAISHFNGSCFCKSIVFIVCYVFLVQSCIWIMPPPSPRYYPGPVSSVQRNQGIFSDLTDAFRGAIDLFLPSKAYAALPVADAGGPYGPLESSWHPITFDGSGSTADEGIAEYHWDFGEYTHTFDGTQIDYDLWVAPTQVIQNDEIIITGAGNWGLSYFFSRHTYQRDSILEAYIKTPSDSYQHLMMGFKNDNETYHYNQMTYAIYFNSGSLYIYEDGSSRGHRAYYTRGLEYEVRIELKEDAGAVYYYREKGSTDWINLYNSNYSAISSFKVGIDCHSASFAVDDINIITHAYGPVVTVPIFVNQTATLTVTDNIGQSTSDTTAVSVQIVTGNPPAADPGGPYTFGEAFANCDRWTVPLDGTGSTDDYEIRTYQWTYGNYTHTFDGTVINKNLWVTPSQVTQNDEIIITGAGGWGSRYFFSRHIYPRDSIIEALVKTPSDSYQHLMVGFKRDNETYNYSQMTYAIYFASGYIYIYEDGGGRGHMASYTRGLSYEIRIELKRDTGALYYFRENGTSEWILLYDSAYSTLSSFMVGADVHSASFSLDNLEVISHAYGPTPTVSIFGDETISLTVEDYAGQTATANTSLDLVGENLPVANPGVPYTFDEAYANCSIWTVSFDGSSSTDDHGICTYEWDFGDGGSGTGISPTHQYSATGTYTLTLTVTDHAGQTHSDSTTVTIGLNNPPIANPGGPYTFDEEVASRGKWSATVNGSSSTDDHGICTYEWDFGDGGSGTGVSFSHQYSATGTYTLSLTVTDHAGLTNTSTTIVTILDNDDPAPSITAPAAVGEESASLGCWSVDFDASGSTDDFGIWRYEWDFGDGSTGTGQNITHLYCAAGTYTATLTVYDHAGQSVATITTIQVQLGALPVADAGGPYGPIESGQLVTFDATGSTDDFGITEYFWEFGEFTHTFDGTQINHGQWTAPPQVIQDDEIIMTGIGSWGTRYFFSKLSYQRDSIFEAVIKTPDVSTQHLMVGFKRDNNAYSYDQMPYAIYFYNGYVYIYEDGSSRGHKAYYTRGSEYEVRIELKKDAGALYYYRERGTTDWTLVYNSSYGNLTSLRIGVDLHTGSFTVDDIKLINHAYGPTPTVPLFQDQTVTLTVTDNTSQTDTDSTNVDVVMGDPPIAEIIAPENLDLGIEGTFNASLSSDDYEIATYLWDFGDGSSSEGKIAYHFYSSIGTYTVTLKVYDCAGQSDIATKTVEVSGENLVVCVPWQIVGGVEVPHDTWSGTEAVLKAVAKSAIVPIVYTWDFGDGTSESGTITTANDRFALEARHIYTGSDGEPFVATITITDSTGITSSDTYRLIIRPKTLEIEENVAIDNGLWWLYKNQIRGTWSAGTYGDAPLEYSYWTGHGSYVSQTASVVQAFLINGHMETGDPIEDPYVETVRRGMRYIFARLNHVNIALQTYGDPDTNGNGIGLKVNENYPPYQGGMVMDAIAATGTPDAVTRTGGINVRGRTYQDILTDMVDMYAWGQDDNSSGGGWRYGWNQWPDNSAAQWGAIGILAAEEIFGINVPQWVKDRNNVWLNSSYGGTGFGYTGRGNGIATTPSGMVQLAFCDKTTSDSRWQTAENWIANNWSWWRNQNNVYAYYAFTKAMRQAQPQEVVTFSATGFDWFGDETNGLARHLINRQQSDLGWPDYYGRTFSSAWTIIILTRTLFVKPPVAIIHASPNPGAIGQEIRFDASASYHLDPYRNIVGYQWDFDVSDGLDWEHPDATGPVTTRTFGQLGDYTVTLRVLDDNIPVRMDTDIALINITIPPHPPTADADGPYIAAAGESVTLDGSGSYDIDEQEGDSITAYGWEIDMIAPRDFDDATGVSPTIPGFDTAGTYHIGLRVTDDTENVFPSSGSPNLTDDDFTEIKVYNNCITDLYVRPKGTKASLVWTHIGADEYKVYRSERGPNMGMELIGTTSSTYSTFIDYNVELYKDYWYRVQVEDGIRICGSYAYHINSQGRIRNRPPEITSTPELTTQETQLYAYDVEANDPDGHAITYLLDQAPDGMSIDETTGLIEWTPGFSQIGPNEVTLRAMDALGASSTQFFIIVVSPRPNEPPVADPGGPYSALRNQAIFFDGSGSFDPEGDPITDYHWVFGDGTDAHGMQVTHTYTASNIYTITLYVTDDRGATGSAETTAQIDEPNRAPIADAGGPYSGDAQAEITFNGSGSSDPDGDPLTYTWNFGDSTPSVTSVIVTHIYETEGTYIVSLTVDDGRGGIDNDSVNVVISPPNKAPVARINTCSSALIDFEDRAVGDLLTDQYQSIGALFSGTGSWSERIIEIPQNGTDFFGNAGPKIMHIGYYAEPTTITFVLPGTDSPTVANNISMLIGDGDNSAETFTVELFDLQGNTLLSQMYTTTIGQGELIEYPDEVATIRLTLVPNSQSGAALDDFSFTILPCGIGNVGDELTFDASSSSDPDGSIVSYEWDFGDGSTTTGIIVTHVFDTPGHYTVSLTVTDNDNATDTFTFVIYINAPPEITSTPETTALEDSLYTYDVEATDEDGDTLTYSLTEAPSGMSINSATGLIQWTPTQDQVGDNQVKVLVNDNNGRTTTQSFVITVQNVNDAPRIISSPILTATEDTPYTYNVEATDEDGDTLTYSLTVSPTGMIIDSATGLIQWTPAQAQIGDNSVTVMVVDGNGGEDTQSFTITVVNFNDPPIITSAAPLTAIEDSVYTYDVEATDEDGDILTFELSLAPNGMTIDENSGLIQWVPQQADVGSHAITITVSDGNGGTDSQSFTLTVENVNDSPEIISEPLTGAVSGYLYNYNVEASDEDGDTLTYGLTTSPAGMSIDSTTGLIQWTPDQTQVGPHPVEIQVTDGQGGSATQSYTLTVSATNSAPQITSTPVTTATQDQPYTYDVEASDPDGDPITFSLDTAPSGMTIASDTGLVQWTPGSAQIGENQVVVAASDNKGATSTQSFTINVQNINDPPEITSTPVTIAGANVLYTYDVEATDIDGDVVLYSLDVSPPAMTIDTDTGLIQWTPADTDVGEHTIQVRARDFYGAFDTQEYTLTVQQIIDNTPPRVSNIIIDPLILNPGETATITIDAVDNEAIGSYELQVDGVDIPMVGNTATYTATTIGVHEIQATVCDTSGNCDTLIARFGVRDPGDTTPPSVNITSPATDSELTAPTDLIGTASDDNLVSYILEYSEKDKNNFVEFYKGHTEVINDILGTLDPSLLINGLYDIRLTAVDVNGLTNSVMVTYRITGDLKVGNFTVTFKDLEIPVAGIPITIYRTYDSRIRHNKGDFGYGWNIDIRTTKVEENRELGEGWSQQASGGFLPTYFLMPDGNHYVSITLPDGQTLEFDCKFLPESQFLYPIQWLDSAVYSPRTGTYGSLVALDDSPMYFDGSYVLNWDFEVYNPNRYQLTTIDGTVYIIDQTEGLKKVTDNNGNSLDITYGGIIHSTGKSVAFTRDTNGRITEISDPMGNIITYEYDINGDLIEVTDQEYNVAQYTYNRTHGLVDIAETCCTGSVRNEYDYDGRLIAVIDANGNRMEFTHDLDTRREVVKDRLDNITVIGYDEQGNVISRTDAFGNTTIYTYDEKGNQLSETDPLNHTTTYTYDERGNNLTKTDPQGNTTIYTYNSSNQILSKTDPMGNTINFVYDSSGNLISATNPLGETRTNMFDGTGSMVSVTDPAGNTTNNEYNSFGDLIKETDPLGNVTTYTYDQNGNQLTETRKFTDSLGNIVTITKSKVYDNKDRVVQEIDALGNILHFEYTPTGKLSAEVDKNGNRTEYQYDIRGNHINTLYPDGTTEIFEYDAENNKTGFTDRAGRTTYYEYDKLYRLVKTIYPDGSSTYRGYDAAGRLIAETDENDNITGFEYDAAGRMTIKTDSLRNVKTFGYDKNGNLVSVTDSLGHSTQYEYDGLNRLTKTIYPDGTSSTVQYNSINQRSQETDQAGNTKRFEYDPIYRLTKVIDPLGNETIFTYDGIGNLISVTDANGNTRSWDYDSLGQKVRHFLPLGMTEHFTYDSNGSILTHTNFNGDVTNFVYDENNRLIEKTYNNGSKVSFTYTLTDKRETVTDEMGETRYDYDLRDRLIGVNNPDGSTISYAYDAAGNRTALTTSSGTTSYTYDSLNRLSTVTDPDGGVTAYTYDKAGNKISVTKPNGTIAYHTYNSLNKLTKVENQKEDHSIISSFTYTLDPVGNRTQIVEEDGRNIEYTYDALYRLLEEKISDPVHGDENISYTYDPVGNRLSKTDSNGTTLYTYDNNNRLLTEGSNSYTYDNNGNTLSKTDGLQTFTYTYDYEDRLIKAELLGDLIEYQYDADGIRIRSTVNGVSTEFLVDKNMDFAQVLEELDSSGSLIARYTYGKELIKQMRDGIESYYHQDGLGSIRGLTDNNQNITDTYIYEAFGIMLSSTGSTVNNYLFAGEQFDSIINAYYLRSRYYNPSIGRFLTYDKFLSSLNMPIEQNMYIYASNNPVNTTDPCGNMAMAMAMTTISISNILLSLAYAMILTYVIMCTLYFVASSLGADIPVPIYFAACKRRGPRRCRCTIRYAPPDIMQQCPPRVFGTGVTMHDCQNNAKFTAPQQCRQYYGHCGWIF